MSTKDSIGDRMKEYEDASRIYLTRRIPVMIRVDGKAFHNFTKGMKKPFDRIFMDAMQKTMWYLCKSIQGCVFGYTQSDEITLVLTDYATPTTAAWFDNNLQKMCSVTASMATTAFNRFFIEIVESRMESNDDPDAEELEYMKKLTDKFFKAVFDARVFSIPVGEVCNCLIWRQQDATRNSIQSVGHANFTYRELQGKDCDTIQDMLFKKFGINWNDFPVDCKRGACCYKTTKEVMVNDWRDPEKQVAVERREWIIDREPPVFTQDRDYIERFL